MANGRPQAAPPGPGRAPAVGRKSSDRCAGNPPTEQREFLAAEVARVAVVPVRALADPANRPLREIIRDEQVMRRRVLAALDDGPLTVPELATALDRPSHEVMFWVMGLRKYGFVAEIKEATDEGYYRYQVVEREGT